MNNPKDDKTALQTIQDRLKDKTGQYVMIVDHRRKDEYERPSPHMSVNPPMPTRSDEGTLIQLGVVRGEQLIFSGDRRAWGFETIERTFGAFAQRGHGDNLFSHVFRDEPKEPLTTPLLLEHEEGDQLLRNPRGPVFDLKPDELLYWGALNGATLLIGDEEVLAFATQGAFGHRGSNPDVRRRTSLRMLFHLAKRLSRPIDAIPALATFRDELYERFRTQLRELDAELRGAKQKLLSATPMGDIIHNHYHWRKTYDKIPDMIKAAAELGLEHDPHVDLVRTHLLPA